jgi:uncharacterized membrane-anchored protein YitT (DUF2179 family)
MPASNSPLRHSLLEDAQALFAATLLVSLGVSLLGKAQLISGGAVGLAFLLHYATGLRFGVLFFAINLPFYLLGWRKMGKVLVVKTFAAVLLLSTFVELIPRVLHLDAVNPIYASVMGGLLMGVGMLILFRHRASLGGFNILVLYLQERYGWRAGYVQLALDLVILALSIPVISLSLAAISILGAAVLNVSLAINHRPGRYIAA